MIIRKLFKFEGAHIVRNCSSVRCKKSIHGHSYTVEVFFTGKGLDNGQMIMDFGLMKGNIKDLIDSFDHAYSMWRAENDEFQQFFFDNSDRWISMPVSPSAEAYSLMFLYIIDKVVGGTEFNNGEQDVQVSSVRVHETATGYAESFREDLEWVDFDLSDIIFSDQIKAEWKDPKMYDNLCRYYGVGIGAKSQGNAFPWALDKPFINHAVEQQV